MVFEFNEYLLLKIFVFIFILALALLLVLTINGSAFPLNFGVG